ncbi:MAG: hypothetical protein KGJ43_02395, partial [Acidobacteriota bacterium]|nr:hypothetical protein [Acidobacteriota bacterium]
YIGRLLLTRYLLAFEVASFLLLIAAVGAVVMAGRMREASGGPGGEEDAAGTRATGNGGGAVPGVGGDEPEALGVVAGAGGLEARA